jgi:CHAT domain-containing protein
MNKRLLGEQHPSVATSLNNLAGLYESQGRYDQAEPLLRQALEMRKRLLGEQHPSVATSLNNLAALYWNQNNFQQTLSYLEQGLAIEEQVLQQNLVGGSQADKHNYLDTFDGTTYAAITLSLQHSSEEANQLALKTLLQRKGRLLGLFANILQILQQNLNPENQALLDRWISTNQQISHLAHLPSNKRPDNFDRKLEQLRSQSQDLQNQLSRRSSQYRQLTQSVEISELASQLPTNSALLEFVLYQPFDPEAPEGEQFGDRRYAAYILHPDGSIQRQDLGKASEINDLVGSLYQGLSSDSYAIAEVKEVAKKVSDRILAPLRPYLQNADHWFVSPDGALNLIPFQVLLDKQGKYLVKTTPITNLTSGGDLLRLDNDSPATSPPIFVGNPYFKKAGATDVALRSATSSTISQQKWGALLETATEVETLAPMWPQARTFLEKQATEAIVKQAEQPQILHLATHGFFQDYPNSDEAIINPLVRSGLVFAGVKKGQSGENEDGVMTALEMAGLDLQGTQMAVLSACETGRGDLSAGQGVYGLQRSLVFAGAESQLVSLWRISDQDTPELMVKYYQRLQNGEGRTQALRQAQLEMLNDPQTAHPYYWSAFIQSGDWRPLDDNY